MNLIVSDIGDGKITVTDEGAGHRFLFKLATLRGAQTLEAMAPAWANGTEPPDGHGLMLRARELAEREAQDQGWIEANDPDVS